MTEVASVVGEENEKVKVMFCETKNTPEFWNDIASCCAEYFDVMPNKVSGGFEFKYAQENFKTHTL